MQKIRKRQTVTALAESEEKPNPHTGIVRGLHLRHYETFTADGTSRFVRSRDEAKTTFAELVYDLAIVIAFATITALMRLNLSGISVTHAFMTFLVVIQMWSQVVSIFNQFDSEDLITRLYLFVQIFAVVMIASYHGFRFEVDPALLDDRPQNVIAIMVIGARFFTTLLRALACVQFPVVRPRFKLTFIEDFLFMLAHVPIFFVSAKDVDPNWFFFIGWFISAVMFPIIARLALGKAGRATVNREHMIERYLLLIVISAGEVIFGATFLDRWQTATAGTWLCTLSGVAIIVSFVIIYIDIDHREETFERHALQNGFVRSFLWFILCSPLMVAINFTGAGLKHTIDETLDVTKPLNEEDFFLFTYSAAAVLILITAIRLLHTEGKNFVFRNPHIIAIRFVGVVILCVLPVDPTGIPAPTLAAIVAAVYVVIAIFSLIGNQYNKTGRPASKERKSQRMRGITYEDDEEVSYTDAAPAAEYYTDYSETETAYDSYSA